MIMVLRPALRRVKREHGFEGEFTTGYEVTVPAEDYYAAMVDVVIEEVENVALMELKGRTDAEWPPFAVDTIMKVENPEATSYRSYVLVSYFDRLDLRFTSAGGTARVKGKIRIVGVAP